jgi:dCTP deaminase
MGIVAFYAESQSGLEPIPLWDLDKGSEKPDPRKYWKSLPPNNQSRIKIEKNRFHILRSREKISVPPGIAVYCRASDETIGEMRIHYAGFAHPWFGWERPDGEPGTPLIFELRGHDVDVSLADGEKMARLTFYRMSEDCKKPNDVSYNTQTLKLSDFFGNWPD